jgi:hypothetical protein
MNWRSLFLSLKTKRLTLLQARIEIAGALKVSPVVVGARQISWIVVSSLIARSSSGYLSTGIMSSKYRTGELSQSHHTVSNEINWDLISLIFRI